MTWLRRNFSAVLTIFIVTAPGMALADSAENRVTNFQTALLDVMKKAETLGVEGRYQRLKPVVSNAFNLPLMAGLAAGEYWKTSTREQRKRLATAFSRMSVATLATLFNSYSGQIFALRGTRKAPDNLMIVDTVLTSPTLDKGVEISYVARSSGDQWRLVDVIVDGGISELRVRISEYRHTLKKGGIEALISLLDGKADQLLS